MTTPKAPAAVWIDVTRDPLTDKDVVRDHGHYSAEPDPETPQIKYVRADVWAKQQEKDDD